MTAEPQLRRLFIAVPLADQARAAIEHVVERVRAAEREAAPDDRPVRWVRLDGLHVTLRFLGPTAEDQRPAIHAAIDATAAQAGRFEIRIAGAGAFPSAGRPRALWLGITEGRTELSRLATRLDDLLGDAGWAREQRPFRGHLTLARSDGVGSGARTVGRLIAEAARLDVSWSADRIVLFESHTGGGPARYERLHEARLAS